MRAATINQTVGGFSFPISYNYFFDGRNRRIRKEHPLGATEDFIYGQNGELLSERSFSADATSDLEGVVDEYIYLGGFAVASVRARHVEGHVKGELSGFCFRRGVPGTCELHQLVGDETGRPVFVLNHLMEVTGVGEYDAFGHRNRISVAGVETQHPASTDVKLGSFERPQRGVLDVQMRVLVSHLDWGGNFMAQPSVVAGLDNGNDHAGAINAVAVSGGTPFLRSDWVGGSMLQVDYLANGQETSGAVVDAIEFDRVHRETTPYFPPMRWPGQYYDEETDLFENWNRYYDPRGGGYLAPEPLLQSPTYVRNMAQGGMTVPTYAYAAQNPIRYADPTGLDIAVIENGPTEGNPVGHTAIAVTGEGVYSFGNNTPLGSSLAAYIKREAPRRNTKIYIIKTTPEQDAAAVASLRRYTKSLGIMSDNCSSRSNAALDAAKVPGGSVFPNIPGTAGTRAMFLPGQLDAKGNPTADFTQVLDIDKTTGSVTIPSALGQFEPP